MMVNNKGMRCLHPCAWKSLKAAWCQFEERKVMDCCQCHWDGEGASLVCWLLMLLVMEESVVIGDGERDMWARVFFLLFFFCFFLYSIFFSLLFLSWFSIFSFTPFVLLILKGFSSLSFFFPPLFHIGFFTPPHFFFSTVHLSFILSYPYGEARRRGDPRLISGSFVLLWIRESPPSIMVTRKPNWSFRNSKARDWLRKGKVLAHLVRPT
jgi:hypothetical protein